MNTPNPSPVTRHLTQVARHPSPAKAEQGGGGAGRDILQKARAVEVSVLLSVINLGEIYYIVSRKLGTATARELIEDIKCLPLDLINADRDRALAASDLGKELDSHGLIRKLLR